MEYNGIGILTLGNGNDELIKQVDYNIELPFSSNHGFCVRFRSELSEQERRSLGLRDDDGNLFMVGDGINLIYWSITDLNDLTMITNYISIIKI
jgi:hypothetical protein